MARRRRKGSNSRPNRGRQPGGARRVSRADGGPEGRLGSGERRIRVIKSYPKVWNKLVLYPRQTFVWPRYVLPTGCPPPLSSDCSTLNITPQWAIACFKPRYHKLRYQYGTNYEAVVDNLLMQEVPHCALQPKRGAEHELRRRVKLAVAVLMNREGIPVRYPRAARFPRPEQAASISQPWLRALLTGWF